MNNPNSHRLPEPNPVTRARHRRQVWLQVLLPVLLIALILVAVAVLAATAPDTSVVRFSDISLIFLILPTAIMGLLALVLLGGLVYLLARLLPVLPRYAHLVQMKLDQVTGKLKRVMDKSTSPVITLDSFFAGVQALLRRGASLGK